jgi:LPS-assembly protein
MFFRACSWSILVVVVLWSSSTLGGVPLIHGGADLPYRIKADSLSYDDTTKTYNARGHVTITKGVQSLQADAVDLNAETMEAEAWGNVHFTSGQDWLTCTRLKMDLEQGIGVLYDGTLFIEESHFYITGGKIEKTGEDSYYIEDGRFTSCDGDLPAWKITGKDLKVKIDGYGSLKHAAFWAKSVPILYAPFLFFPAKVTRQTGLLVPLASYSDRDGFQYTQPFFWAISDSSDATFYESYMDKRGFKHGVEYRYVLAPESKGAAMYDFLYDRQIDDGTGLQDANGSDYEGFMGDDENRLNRKRWWFRMKSDQALPAGFKAKLDVDVVSDQDYLREFRSGYSSFNSSDSYFLEEFGRDLDDYTDTVRLNQLSLNRNGDYYSLNADLRWYDNVIIRKNGDPDTTLQRLPHVQFDGSKQQLFDSPLYFNLESSYDYFWREHGTRGHRTDLHPRLYYPMQLFKYLDFEPSVGGRETLWQIEEYGDETPEQKDRFFARELFDFKADLSTEFWKTFNVKGRKIDRIRHTVRPQVVYDYIPVPEEEDLPNFEGIDRIEEKNVVTYSVTNFFTARSTRQPTQDSESNPGSEQGPGTPLYTYHDFCRIKFTQSYDIQEARRDEGGVSKRPFSDIKGELEFRPHHCLDLDGDVAWSPYDNEFKSYNAILTMCDRRGDRISVDYLYSRDESESVFATALVKLFHPVSVYGEHERNIKDGKSVETVIGFMYEPQCWSLNLSYTDDRTMDTQEYFVELSLYGLGKVGL